MDLNESSDACPVGYETLPGRKLAQADLGDALVVGLGVSGKALVKYLLPLIGSRVRTLTVIGGKSAPETSEWASTVLDGNKGLVDSRKLVMAFDTEDVASFAPDGGFSICLISPGISMFSDLYRNASQASSRTIGELEFAWEESSSDSVWVAITGTNGKTTTTMLTEHILREAGLRAHAIGNVGFAAIEEIARDLEGPRDDPASPGRPYYVAEASSYQLASTQCFAPDVAVVLGITPDHVKWHRTHDHYKQSKFKVLDNLSRADGAVAVLDATNDDVREKVKEIKAIATDERGYAYIPLGTSKGISHDMREACGSENAAFASCEGGELIVALSGKEHHGGPAAELKIKGTHNIANALAAMSIGVALGVDDESLRCALSSFSPLEHRIEPVGTVGNVLYVNDSKATNVDATIQAVAAFEPKKPIILLGGHDKGTDLEDLVDSCAAHASAAICFGEARDRFHRAFAGTGLDLHLAAGLDEAFDLASGIASDGDIVLLSPACASFDEFTCFEERGEHFKDLVSELEKRAGERS